MIRFDPWARYTWIILAAGGILCLAPIGSLRGEPAPDFDRQIAPLLAARCLECHAGAEPEGGLDLSRRQAALDGGDSGSAIVPGKLADSMAWERIEAGDMPPKHPLADDEKALLKRWIEAGAAWSTDPIDRFAYTTDSRAGYDWWSLQPLKSVELPRVKQQDWPRNEIDRFVLQRLEEAHVAPSPEAAPRVLIRRLYYNLIGLPPTPEEVEAFVADPSDAAYAAVVDKLLASEHYGERWGRHWLDVARFGESHGFERNDPRHNAWHYRDWVIAALNRDMPYDEFVRHQLAGDVLAADYDGTAAVGFLVAGVHNTVVGSSERMKLLARQDELEEIAGAVGQTFLGLTINCARCHDHKFDPIPTEEYYQFISALDGVTHGERDVAIRDSQEEYRELEKQTARLADEIEGIDDAARERILAARTEQPQAAAELPQPYAAWEFDDDLEDGVGELHGQLFGEARLENGALVLDGQSGYVKTAPIGKDVSEKTLEAWVLLDSLDQRGGGVIGIETLNGQFFDAIVYGEREPHRWMAGSNFFARTKSFNGPAEEATPTEPVHLAMVYHSDGTIAAYRNGQPYGDAYQSGMLHFKAGGGQVLFGLRHSPAGGGKHFAGKIIKARLYDQALSAEAVAASAGVESSYVSVESIIATLAPEQAAQRAKLDERLAAARARQRELGSLGQKAKVFTVAPRNPGVMKVHIRGGIDRYGDEVAPGGIDAIAGVSGNFEIASNAPDAARRKALAEWITDHNNPLFARVIVNRVWHYHFGKGIVPTPNDLGYSGGQPSHPQLLDWLAISLQEDDYRLKPLHRRIVMSATYRQASAMRAEAHAVDAGNRLLWRSAPQRVEGEVLRDSMLQAAGKLNPQRGGPGYVDVSITPNNGTNYYEPIDPVGEQFNRRTVYRFSPRGGRSALLDTFDCPDPSAAAPKRSVTTTPLQALSLLNNSLVLRMSEAFADRVKQQAGDDAAEQAVLAWRLALCRAPTDEERQLSTQLIAERGLPALCRALFNCNEFVYIE